MAGVTRIEHATLGFGDRCSTKLSYTPILQEVIPALVRSGRLELAGLSIKSRLLYQLSYERLLRICHVLLVGHD